MWKQSWVEVLFVIVTIVNIQPRASGFVAGFRRRHHRIGLSKMSKGTEESLNRDATLLRLAQAKEVIARAISIGAPAYNAGDISKCAEVYQEASNQLGLLLPNSYLRTKLKKEQSQMDNMDDDSKAWALRRVFDEIAGYQLPFGPMTSTCSDNIVFQPFDESTLPASVPRQVMDNVMGGISQGYWIPESKTFRGTTSLANNGGFASLRWRMEVPQNWSRAQGIYLRGVQHSNTDHHTFRIILKDANCDRIRLTNFKATFANPISSKDPIMIPFSAFDQMEQMGRPLMGSPSFQKSAVTEIGLMAIKPTVVGPFELRFAEWGLYANNDPI